MITLKEYLEAIDYKITGGSDFGWQCFGPNARYLDCNDSEGADGNYSVNALFDSVTQTIYSIEVWDYVNNREYRWFNPDYKFGYEDESSGRGIDFDESIDGRKYIDLDLAEDILEKITAIVAGKEYDSRVKVPVDFSDEELLKYMKLAHERDMTFNEFVEEALRFAIEEFKNGRLTKEDAQEFIRSRKK
jgi:hypothetical protein